MDVLKFGTQVLSVNDSVSLILHVLYLCLYSDVIHIRIYIVLSLQCNVQQFSKPLLRNTGTNQQVYYNNYQESMVTVIRQSLLWIVSDHCLFSSQMGDHRVDSQVQSPHQMREHTLCGYMYLIN